MKTDFNKLTISSYFFRRRIKLLTRLFYGLIITCFLLTAYLYGLIEIDSHKVVFKIMPSGLGSHKTHFINYKNSKDSSNNNNNNMQSSTNEDYFVNIKQHNSNNKKLSSSSSDSDLKNLKYNNNSNKNKRVKFINLEKLNIEKNISKLFATIERYSVQIKTQLRSYEASNIADLKEKYEKLGQERKARLKKELNKLKAKKTATTTIKNNQTIPLVDNVNADDDDDDDDDEEDEDLSLASEFSNQETVTRELMVRFLRYENYKLKKKQNSEIRTIKNILAQFDLNKELDTK
jgi:hypothetical protein